MASTRRATGPIQMFLASKATQWITLGCVGFYTLFPEQCQQSYQEMLEGLRLAWKRLLPNATTETGNVDETGDRGKRNDTSRWILNTAREMASSGSIEGKIAVIVVGGLWLSYKLVTTFWQVFRPTCALSGINSRPAPQHDDSEADKTADHPLPGEDKSLHDKTSAVQDKVEIHAASLEQHRQQQEEIPSDTSYLDADTRRKLQPEFGALSFEFDRNNQNAPFINEDAAMNEQRVLEDTLRKSLESTASAPYEQDVQDKTSDNMS